MDIKLTYRYLVLVAVSVLMAACGHSDMPAVDEPVDVAVGFSGGLLKNDVASKAGDDSDQGQWLDMVYDTWMWGNGDASAKSPVDFVIYQDVDGGSMTESAVYRLKPGETNRLECVDGQIPLNWKSKIAKHVFHAWTEPAGVDMAGSRVSGTVDMSKRNLDYEYFVGARTDELSYVTHGLTVALKFEHLVGKLIIDKVSLIYNDKVESQNMWDRVGSIYFPNMPTTGLFNTGVDGGGMAVTPDGNDNGVLFVLSGNDDYNQYVKDKCIPFYLMPMLFDDGNDYGEFYINFMHPNDGPRRYKGNLKDLVNEEAAGDVLSGIKAGECLTVRLVLQDNVVRGFWAYVANWSDDDPKPVKDKPKGIYDAYELLNNLTQTGSVEWTFTPKDDSEYDTTDDGKKIIRIYDNLDLSVYNYKGKLILVVPDGYVLDGLGHDMTGIPELEIVGDVRNLYIEGKPVGDTPA